MSAINKEKKFYTAYSKLSEVKLITIGLASPERIKQWAEKTLPNGKILGEVINANTLHHKTFKPQKGGLFCERIFGPLKDFECACGKPLKYKKNLLGKNGTLKGLDSTEVNPNKSILGNTMNKSKNFCSVCEVEYTWSVMRRYQLGYIQLTSPVTHVWYLKGNPSYLSILLDMKKRHLEYITYCSETLTLENALKGGNLSSKSSDIVSSWNKLKEQMKSIEKQKLTDIEPIKNINLFELSIQKKIEKRQQIELKRNSSWKQLYQNQNNLLFSKTNKNYPELQKNNGEVNNIPINNIFYDQSKMNEKLKNYSKRLNLKKLLVTWFLILEGKKQNLIGSKRSGKQILKNLPIQSYIMMDLFKNKKENSLISKVKTIIWQNIINKALIQSIRQTNKILTKLDLTVLKEGYLKKSTIKIQEDNLALQLLLLNNIKKSSDTLITMENAANVPIMKYFSDDIKKLKLSFNTIIENFLFNLTNSNSTLKTKYEFTILLYNSLELYTLSNFPNESICNITAHQTSDIFLKTNLIKKTSEIMIKNLVPIFKRILIKNSALDLKNLICLKQQTLQEEFSDNPTKLNKIDFKKALGNLLNLKLENDSTFIVCSPKPKNSKIIHYSKPLIESGIDEANKKKLYNNIYCLSHRERWEVENDWNFLYYFVTAPLNDGAIIPNYKNRYDCETSFNDSNGSLTYQNISLNFQKSAFFSGPGIVQNLLTEFNFYEIKKMDKQNRILLYQLNKQIFKLKKFAKHERFAKKELKEAYKKRDLLIRRTKLVRKLFIKESSPESIILTILPVLPPDLRPIVKMGGQIAASDLNRLYQRVIYRNDRLKKFLKDPATSHSYEMKYAQRLLQEAVDNLIQNGKSGVVSEKDSRGRALKSLSDILKGKQGRFRQYLLGKRVDYSGRSVIVVGPKLKLHECGIPKEMALELYLPFLLKRILNENLSKTVVGAKTLIKTNPSLVWELLREIMQTCPVLLNRAPTLHRLGIQAFQPKLIDGRAILLHPLVCSAFNADFDGDQMAVHIPITVEARAEAWKLMLSRNNILSPATGEPLAIPSQDMVLGCYYLTTNLLNRYSFKGNMKTLISPKGSGFYFANIKNALNDFQTNKLNLHANIWLKWDHLIENGTDQEEPIELRMDSNGNWKEIYNKLQKNYTFNNQCSSQYVLTTPGKILFNQIIHKTLI